MVKNLVVGAVALQQQEVLLQQQHSIVRKVMRLCSCGKPFYVAGEDDSGDEGHDGDDNTSDDFAKAPDPAAHQLSQWSQR